MSLKGLRWNQITAPPVFLNQRCWQAWVRPTRRFDTVIVEVCGCFQAGAVKEGLGGDREKELKLKQSLTGKRSCPVGKWFRVFPPKCLTKDYNKSHRGGVHNRFARACGDSSRLIRYARKIAAIHSFQALIMRSWYIRHIAFHRTLAKTP